jgi:hypothetical protein
MAWNQEMLIILRHMISDLATPPTYSDSRLIQLLAVAAQFVQEEVGQFQQSYSIDVVNSTITPDPTLTQDGVSVRDDSFMNLTMIKAACIIDGAAARLAAQRSVIMRDADKQIDLHFVSPAVLQVWQKGWCKNYEDTRFEYVAGNSGAAGTAIIGPFRAYAAAGGPWTPDGGDVYGGSAIYGGRRSGLPNDGRFR